MSEHVKCPSCAAPLDVDGSSTEVRCTFCGTLTLLPSAVHEHRERRVERQAQQREQQRDRQLKHLNEWWETMRKPYMEIDGEGIARPPRAESAKGFALMFGGLLLSMSAALVCALGGAFVYQPLLFVTPIAVMFTFFPLVMPGVFMIKHAKDRHKKYKALESEYQRRYAILRGLER